MIFPVILYNCEIRAASLLKKKNYSEQNLAENLFHLQCLQEDLHMKFTKIVLGVNSKANNFAVRSELGRFPLHIKIYIAMLKYWNRLNDLIDDPIIVYERIVNEDICVSKDYTFSWLSSIEMLVKVTRYFQYWNDGSYSSKSFPNEFVKKLKSMFVDEWKNKMTLNTSREQAEQRKLSFYCKIKKELKMERYLSVIQNLEIRNYVARFRISAHKFPIGTGRYINTERQNCVKEELEMNNITFQSVIMPS